MTKLLDNAVKAAERLPPALQDEIAGVIMRLAGEDAGSPILLSREEREAIAGSKAAASRGEFASEEEVRTVWSRHGL